MSEVRAAVHRCALVAVTLLALGVESGLAVRVHPACAQTRGIARDASADVAGPANIAELPGFATFGWVSPPLAFATFERYAELAHAGFNVTVLAWQDSGRVADNRARLDACRLLDVRCLLYDNRLERVDFHRPETFAWVDSVVATYRDDPAFLGYYLGDEPQPGDFGLLDTLSTLLRARDTAHPPWNNLIGRGGFATREAWMAYTREYVRRVRPSVLCNDQYDFLHGEDGHHLVENVAGLAEVARDNGLPFWGIVLLVGHGYFRQPTAGELRWELAQWLSYGARGVGVFTYWSPIPDPYYNWQMAMISWDGTRTAMYDTVTTLLMHVRAVGDTLATRTWLATRHAGSLPVGGTPFTPDSVLSAVGGRAAIGLFVDRARTPHLFVANSDSLSGRKIHLAFTRPRRVSLLAADRIWRPVYAGALVTELDLPLAAGDFALLRVEGTLGGPLDVSDSGRFRPSIVLAPNPARRELQLDVAVAGEGTLEILELSGRRLWMRRISGSGGHEWHGERDAGGRVPPGVYVVRLKDARGTVARRIAWLGSGR